MEPRLKTVLGVAVGTGLLIGVFSAAMQGGSGDGTRGASVTVRPSPTVSQGQPATPVTASANATYDDGAADANRAVGWHLVEPGTPAARYWERHGVGDLDGDPTGYSACEAALRLQFVRGYLGTSVDGRRALWQVECGGVSDVDRESILTAAVEWSATHAEGDG